MQKSFYKKKVCLPTDPKIFGHVTRNEACFSLALGSFAFTKKYVR